MCGKMDSLIRKFWWGHGDQQRHLYLKSWDKICTQKLLGGLDFRKFCDINIAFITKLGWKMCVGPTRLWVQLVRSKYL